MRHISTVSKCYYKFDKCFIKWNIYGAYESIPILYVTKYPRATTSPGSKVATEVLAEE